MRWAVHAPQNTRSMNYEHPDFDQDSGSQPAADLSDGWIDELLDDVLNRRVERSIDVGDDSFDSHDRPIAGYLNEADQRLAAIDPDDLMDESNDHFEELFLGDEFDGLSDHDADFGSIWSDDID